MVLRPDEAPGETTTWYASFWDFCKFYFPDRFGNDWIISPESSLALHVGDRAVPGQLIVHSPRGTNHKLDLLHDTSIYDLKRPVDANALASTDGLNVYRLANALCLVAPSYFQQHRNTSAAALGALRNSNEILQPLLAGGHVRPGGRTRWRFPRHRSQPDRGRDPDKHARAPSQRQGGKPVRRPRSLPIRRTCRSARRDPNQADAGRHARRRNRELYSAGKARRRRGSLHGASRPEVRLGCVQLAVHRRLPSQRRTYRESTVGKLAAGFVRGRQEATDALAARGYVRAMFFSAPRYFMCSDLGTSGSC